MKSTTLTVAFQQISKEIQLPVYLKEVTDRVIDGSITPEAINNILDTYQINLSIAKVGFLHLIFAYIKWAIEDGILSTEEKEDIRFLKTIFRIKPGDFYLHNKADVEKTITDQLEKIYKDNFVSETEAGLKVDIQEVFDLSFDQMNDYAKIKAATSINQGANVKDLDVFFSYNEYFKLKSK